jgi:hypothetical protein
MSGVVVDISPADPSAMSRLTNIDLWRCWISGVA